jgi:hypothetical protein
MTKRSFSRVVGIAATMTGAILLASSAYADTVRALPTIQGMVTKAYDGGATISTNAGTALTGVSMQWNTGTSSGSTAPAASSVTSATVGR